MAGAPFPNNPCDFMHLLVATQDEVLVVDPSGGGMDCARGVGDRPTCLAADPLAPSTAWCGTRSGAYRSDDGGRSWRAAGLEGRLVMSMAVSPTEPGVAWAGTEPSGIWRSADGVSWELCPGLDDLPSSSEWAFPPRPETHHVRWIACHPSEAGRLWAAIEAGALISTRDGGRTWHDRVAGGPYDTHELEIHPAAANVLRSAAGDGYFESHDAGETWSSPERGLDVRYLRSVATDPGRADAVVVSAASGPRSAYVAGVSDGRLFRRVADGEWERVTRGWPDPPATIAPLLTSGSRPGEIWAADERGVHRSDDGGIGWILSARFERTPNHLRGLVLLP
jgi:photosystem II stability/assembly factor-like uncharacterized protein